MASIRCLVGPVAPRPCRSGGEYAWRFISHLGLNYLSLVDTDAPPGRIGAARDAAALCAVGDLGRGAATGGADLDRVAIRSCGASPAAGPIAAGRGLEVTLTIDEAPFGGAGGILLASVLDRFFAKYVSINAFTETVLRSPERGEVMRWPPRFGQRPVL